MAIFHYKGNLEEADYVRAFVTDQNEWLFISSFNDGVATAEPYASVAVLLSAYDYFTLVSSCFDEESNFKQELMIAFERSADTPFDAVMFEYEGVGMTVTKSNRDPDVLYELWEDDMGG